MTILSREKNPGMNKRKCAVGLGLARFASPNEIHHDGNFFNVSFFDLSCLCAHAIILKIKSIRLCESQDNC